MQKNLILFILTFTIIGMTNISSYAQKGIIDNSTVDNMDLNRFLGTWYEIARFPHNFEKDLVGVTATYSLDENQKIKVVNRGYKNNLNGPVKETIGKAKIPNPQKPGNLKVSFFWFFYVDYLILELDTQNYQWAVIGSSSPNYLWILSRESHIDDNLYSEILKKIKKRGYDMSKLIKVTQK